jgi:glycine dehydrogenase subunit 1
MQYFPLTENDRQDILKTLNIKDIKELFSDIPKNSSYYSLETIPPALTEDKLIKHFKELAALNRFDQYQSFLGGGAYRHFIPEVVNFLSSKAEFVTPYTPYQPEVSQGSLQGMFEYQTMMTMLTGLDVSNASLYDGGTAAAEAVLLAFRKSRKNKILIARNLHPEYIEIIETYLQNFDFSITYVNFNPQTGTIDINDLKTKLSADYAGFIFQSPNFLGQIEETRQITDLVHSQQCYSILVVNEAMSLPFLTSPGENGIDICVGEAQSFGLPLGFGGPYLGFMVVKKDFVRQMPGRIVGQTVDMDGKRGYVLTLSTREQHIKREKATSNICSNQAWCAMRAGMYLSTIGKTGLQKLSRANHANAVYFCQQIDKLNQPSKIKIKYPKNYFNELVVEINHQSSETFLSELENQNILAGIPLKWFFPEFQNSLLVNFTEIHNQENIDQFVNAIARTL